MEDSPLFLQPELREQLGGVRTVAAGRTDSGVHARGQALHFDLPTAEVAARHGWDLAPGKLGAYLNRALLPPDVRMWNVSRAPPPRCGHCPTAPGAPPVGFGLNI